MVGGLLGDNLGTVRVSSGTVWGQLVDSSWKFRVRLGTVWGQFWGSFGDRFGIVWGQFGDRVVRGQFRDSLVSLDRWQHTNLVDPASGHMLVTDES